VGDTSSLYDKVFLIFENNGFVMWVYSETSIDFKLLSTTKQIKLR